MPGAIIPLPAEPGVQNWATQSFDQASYYSFNCDIFSDPGAYFRCVTAMRFYIPPGVTASNLRTATFQLSGFDNVDSRNDLYCTMAAEKIANSLPLQYVNPVPRWLSGRTIAEVSIGVDNVAPGPKIVNIMGDSRGALAPLLGGGFTVADILQEVMAVSGWGTTSRAVTFLFAGRPDLHSEQWVLHPGYGPDYCPQLTISYGDDPPGSINFDLGFLGDSHACYPGHAGYPKDNIPVQPMGNIAAGTYMTVNGCIGMYGGTSGIAGSPAYGGDNFRGWTDQGYVQDSMEEKWGDAIAIYRAEYALGGTMGINWGGNMIDNMTSTSWWGDPDSPGSLRYRLAHPLSPSGRQVWIVSLGGNDCFRWGSQNLIHDPTNQDYVDSVWDGFIEYLDPFFRRVMDEIFTYAEDPNKCWVYCPGYPNFPFFTAGSASPLQTLPSFNGQDLFRHVACLENFGIAARQYQYDGLDQAPGHYDGALANQSAVIQAGAFFQQINYPSDIPPGFEYNPRADRWWLFYGIPFPPLIMPGAPVNFPPAAILSYSYWYYAGHDMWQIAMRNVTDINANRMTHRVTDTLWNRMQADYPNVIYRPSWDLLGVDEEYSADPTSPYAQSPGHLWVEGIHPNMAGLNLQWNAAGAQLDQLATFIPILQGFATNMYSLFTGTAEIPLRLEGMWNGTEVLELYFSNLASGDEEPTDPNLPPVASFTIDISDLTVIFTSTSTDPDGTIVEYEWAFGDAFTGSGAVTSHTYPIAGTYTAVLTVTDDDGAFTATSVEVTVTGTPPPNVPPTAAFTVVMAELTVTCTSTSDDPDGVIVSYLWDFGDGTTGTGEVATHTYAVEGTYTIGLTITDDTGETSEIEEEAVTNPPLPGAFPGDIAAGFVRWGCAFGGNNDPVVRHEIPAGTTLGLRRTFWTWNNKSSSMIAMAEDDLALGRLPWVSFKPPAVNDAWAAIGAGTYDSSIDIMLNLLGDLDGPVWLTFHHEPENDLATAAATPGGATAWRSAQTRIRQRITATGVTNIAFAPVLMAYTYHSESGRNPNDWWVNGIWDFVGLDHYQEGEASPQLALHRYWTAAVAYLTAKGRIPIAVGEWGNRGATTAAANEMQQWYNTAISSGSTPQSQTIGLAAFDSGLNSPLGSWELVDPPLTKFHELMAASTSLHANEHGF